MLLPLLLKVSCLGRGIWDERRATTWREVEGSRIRLRLVPWSLSAEAYCRTDHAVTSAGEDLWVGYRAGVVPLFQVVCRRALGVFLRPLRLCAEWTKSSPPWPHHVHLPQASPPGPSPGHLHRAPPQAPP